jgi:hypothetical protein
MTAPRSVAALASLVFVLAASGCTNFYEIPIETPIQPKMDITPFSRVLVAGFISGGTDDVDANMETVRLLRSQLRSKSALRVIEAQALPLTEIARDHVSKQAGAASAPAAAQSAPAGPTSGPGIAEPMPGEVTNGSTPAGQQPVPGLAPDGRIRNEQDLERYQAFFSNTEFWKRLGEEHQNPLIVTGTVLFTNTQTSGFVNTNREVIDPLGRRIVQPMRVYMERKGFIIEPRFIFIDGRTGEVLYSDRFHEEILYPAQQNVPALSSYFELMDRLIPSFLGSLSTQRIRGTRVLLK